MFSRTANGCGHRQIAMALRAKEGVAIAGKIVLRIMHKMDVLAASGARATTTGTSGGVLESVLGSLAASIYSGR